ncbi:hypothetical protein C4J81_04735 [Deltaproteobacteria bacterium Smac51]|nr:hypothetical protein C4J81_04735 [Deltaproteobacteria bacterium Smac51]
MRADYIFKRRSPKRPGNPGRFRVKAYRLKWLPYFTFRQSIQLPAEEDSGILKVVLPSRS